MTYFNGLTAELEGEFDHTNSELSEYKCRIFTHLISFLGAIEIRRSNLKNLSNKLCAQFETIRFDYNSAERFTPICDLMEEIECMCETSECEKRELNESEISRINELILKVVQTLRHEVDHYLLRESNLALK